MSPESWLSQGRQIGLAASLALVTTLTSRVNNRAYAQIVPDDTLGADRSRVMSDPNAPFDLIEGGALRGTNLFHSFEQFNVGEGRITYFLNPSGTENVVSRVTGGSPSQILGTLGLLDNANLFLINPNGIIFGSNATLDVAGSFVATTANAIEFGNQGIFSASAPDVPPVLTVNPSAFFFNQTVTRAIVNSSAVLQVREGNSLLLLGGDVELAGGSLFAPSGRLELGAVAGRGTVGLTVDGNNLRLSFPNGVARADISLTDGARVQTNRGDIQLSGRRVTIADGSQILANTLGSEPGGNITVTASEFVRVIGISPDGQFRSGLFTKSEAAGAAGNLRIATGRLIVRDGAQVSASTSGEGQGGMLDVTASQSVEVTGGSRLLAQTQGAGDAGNLRIATGRLIVRDRAQVSASTFGEGQGGMLDVTASQFVKVTEGSRLLTQTRGAGDAGNLRIATGRLIVQDGAQVGAGTFSEGQGGRLTVRASQSVQLIGTLADGQTSSGLFTQTEGAGDAGNLRIATEQLIVQDGAQISSSTFDEGQGGRLTVRASDSVQLIGSSAEGTSSGLFAVTKGGSGAAGDLRISTGRLIVRDGAQVSASNFGTGQGRRGNLTVRASESVELNGISANSPLRSGLFVGTAGIEDAGDLTIDTGRLVVRDGAVVSAGSRGQGNGGTLTVRASESVQLLGTSADGKPSSLLTQASDTGSAGNLTIETEQLIVRDGAGVTVSSEGSGDAGELQIQARSITLDNKAALSATTRSGNGGDITLSVQDLLLLRRNSEISTTAGIAGDGGNGGNIIIDAKDGFIVAIPEENSDIKANAFTGRGGTVQITAQGIFGLVPRSLEELKTLLGTDDPNQLDPARLPSDDITAISQTDPALSGQVSINTPDVDPSRGLVALPTEVVDASRLVASGCGTPQRIAQSKFIITGRGGLPPSPSDTLSSDAVWSDLRSHTQQAENQPSAAVATQTTDPTTAPLVEAQGWVINDKGQVVLTATAPTVTPHNPWQTPAACRRS